MEKTLSVIIPVYNTAEYLDKCLLSVTSQTYKKLEIIIVDDGSTDNSTYICDKWAKIDKRISVYHQINRGVSQARNFGMDMANGKYITFLDGDDWLESDMYGNMIQQLENGKYKICASGYCREKQGKKIHVLKKASEGFICRKEALKEIFDFKPISEKVLSWEVCDKIFCREIIQNIRFDSNVEVMEDMLFLWQVFQNVDGIYFLPLYKYNYLIRDNSATTRKISNKNLGKYDAIKIVWMMAQFEDSSVKEVIYRRFLASLVVNIYEMMMISPQKYKEKIISRQVNLRKNFVKAICVPNMGLLGITAIILECMPYGMLRFIFLLKKLITG